MSRQAVILAGGKGTRLGETARLLPKALVPVGGRPLLEHLLHWCSQHGFEDVIICAGHLADQMEAFVHGGTVTGLKTRVSIESETLGTAGPLRLVKEFLQEEFLVLYGDVFIDFDPEAMISFHQKHRPVATLLTRASDHPWDSHLVNVDPDGIVREFIARRELGRHYQNLANAAVYLCSRRVLDFIPAQGASDFGADVFPTILSNGGRLAAWELKPPGFVKDMGTPERLAALDAWLEERTWMQSARQSRLPIKTVFLDRDGTLNVERGLICRPEDLQLLPGAARAVRILNEAGLQTVVVTNQPVVARGLCTVAELDAIHEKLRAELAREGARLDAIYYSPFHPETHHGEGVAELRRASRCRKPDVGMLMQAVRDLGVDLRSSILVGNTGTDIETARNANIRSLLVESPALRSDAARPDWHFPSLLGAAEAIVAGSCDAVTADF